MSRPTSRGRPVQRSSPPEAWGPLLRLARRAARPLERFLRIEAASGILLLVAALVALAWANSPWAESYVHLWHTPVGIRLGSFTLERSLEWFVNDVLMVIFFFVVGMEIRREINQGELSDWRRAGLPAAAALGGMLAPAGLYLLTAAGRPALHPGWGVPMATDIAFAVGILTLLGRRVPAALRVLLLALAVIDDLGAIIVIALFYSPGIEASGIRLAALGFAGILVMQRVGVRAKLAYVVPSVVAWAGIYAAGIHPTITGVIIGLLTPVRAWLGPEGFITGVREELQRVERATSGPLSSREFAESLRQVNAARREAMSPAESLIEALHPWVAYGIMPFFALSNAGVAVDGAALQGASSVAAAGVALGLVIGKPIGVLAACWLALRLRVGVLPAGIKARHLVVLGVVAGVGFTMSIFIAQLAFADPQLLAGAKLGVLGASAVAAVAGVVIGRLLLAPVTSAEAAQTADEAEDSTEI
ncbi:MAG: Na+/H+ antiporter NhaA [Proteobacteria bacterium]|nr:Na+/H+ antiporter NhaA [Pseudomonadota bacterium]